MQKLQVSIVDKWIGRLARPEPEAIAAIAGLTPAVVVTGGSRGIGLALALRFAEAGRAAAIVARRRATLEAAAAEIRERFGTQVSAIDLDVTKPEAPEVLERRLREAGLYIDILINNAGIGLSGHFDKADGARLEELMALNIAALTRLMRRALPQMQARGRGGVLNVASLGGAVPGPHQAAYYASKAYVISLTEAVAAEMSGRGVRVAVLAPGPVNTSFHAAMGAEQAYYRRLVPAHTPAFVARSAYRGFMLGRRVIVPGALNTAAALALRLLPHSISVPLVAFLLNPRQRITALTDD